MFEEFFIAIVCTIVGSIWMAGAIITFVVLVVRFLMDGGVTPLPGVSRLNILAYFYLAFCSILWPIYWTLKLLKKIH